MNKKIERVSHYPSFRRRLKMTKARKYNLLKGKLKKLAEQGKLTLALYHGSESFLPKCLKNARIFSQVEFFSNDGDVIGGDFELRYEGLWFEGTFDINGDECKISLR
jgi:hypothetical protein